MSMWLGRRNNSDTNRTFTDPVVKIEALSTAWQAMTLMENMGMDAGHTVRSCRSRAAGTHVVTNWGERSTAGCRHHRDNPWMVFLPGDKPHPRGSMLADGHLVRTVPVTPLSSFPHSTCLSAPSACKYMQWPFLVLWQHSEAAIANQILWLGKLRSWEVNFSLKDCGDNPANKIVKHVLCKHQVQRTKRRSWSGCGDAHLWL